MSGTGTVVLLIEANSVARAEHERALVSADYDVRAFAACPDIVDLHQASIVLSDIPSFDWLLEQRIDSLPPIVVVSAEERAGITACLCGAAAWVPAYGDLGYMLDTIDGVLPFRRTATVGNG